ncbi:hypothetical protein AAHZ94_14840 [Streptomyces sp. HSW2009]|uniref:hypothetical protein n=1 Tax=Streptomyces sp. HSW2009 TaxID=3142890 RepID=UPI0032EF093A
MLACAAVPVMAVAGCSSDSGDKDPKDDASKSASVNPSPTVAAARYAKLPEACKTLGQRTVDDLVPKAKDKKGKTLPSANINESASCLWSGLDGYQYRQLSVSMKLFPSELNLGTGDKRAAGYAAQQTERASTADGARGAKKSTATGIGDEATTVGTTVKKDGDDFKNETVVARAANVVVTVEYRGAGYEDAKPPKPEDLQKDAQKAAKEAVSALAKANEDQPTESASPQDNTGSNPGSGSGTDGDDDHKSTDTSGDGDGDGGSGKSRGSGRH